jgi:hypothetical protein
MSARTMMLGLFLLALLGGCSSRAAGSDSGSDRTVLPPDGGPILKVWTYTADDDGTQSPVVSLKPDPTGTDVGALIVVARGVAKLQGVGLRLTFDPQHIQVTKSEVGTSWYGSGHDVVSKLATRTEGALWAGIGYSGSFGLNATSEVTLARVQLKLSGEGPAPIAFPSGRNLVLDPDGAAVKVTWLGGTFTKISR